MNHFEREKFKELVLQIPLFENPKEGDFVSLNISDALYYELRDYKNKIIYNEKDFPSQLKNKNQIKEAFTRVINGNWLSSDVDMIQDIIDSYIG